MFDTSQLLKGTLEGCILKIVSTQTTYGYEIVLRLGQAGFTGLKEGTVYPLLLRLEKKGLLQATFRPSPLGPSRKYFSLTQQGTQTLAEFEAAWQQVSNAVQQVMQQKGDAS